MAQQTRAASQTAFIDRGRDPAIYHPHVHFVVPCGGLSDDGKQWMATPIHRKKFREILTAADLEKHVDPTVWHRWWEVSVKAVSDGRAVLKYLAPYVFRVAISDNRILECTDESVKYNYTPSGTKTSKIRTVEGVKFVRGFLQHVLPKSYLKVRYYGWMASNSRTTRD